MTRNSRVGGGREGKLREDRGGSRREDALRDLRRCRDYVLVVVAFVVFVVVEVVFVAFKTMQAMLWLN